MAYTFNPFTGTFDITQSIGTLNGIYLRLDATNDPVTGQLNIELNTATASNLVLKTLDDSETSPILSLLDSTGAIVLASFFAKGRFVQNVSNTVVGTLFNGDTRALTLNAGATSITASQRALNFTIAIEGTGGGSSSVLGMRSLIQNNQTTGTITTIVGNDINIQNTNAGIITGLTGLRSTTTLSGSGNVTTGRGIDISAVALSSTGVIVTNVGLDIRDQGATGITTSYGLRIQTQSASTTFYSLQTNNGLVVFNEAGDSTSDVRIEGDADANLFFTDASTDRIGIGNSAPTARLMIDGRADEIQLIVQGNATQTADLMQLQNSAGTAVVSINKDGGIGLWGTPDAVSRGVMIEKSLSALATAAYYGGNFYLQKEDSDTKQIIGVYSAAYQTASSGSQTGEIIGLWAETGMYGGGNTTTLKTVYVQSGNYGAGTLINLYGIYLDANGNTGGGVITNNYGLFIGNQSVGGTLNYAIFTGTGLNEFNDQVFVDGSADRVQLLVQANATQTTLLSVWENSAGTDQITFAGDGGAVFNEAGNAVTFRVEGDADPNLITAYGFDDKVGIGIAVPTTKLHVYGQFKGEASRDDIIWTVKAWSSQTNHMVEYVTFSDVLLSGVGAVGQYMAPVGSNSVPGFTFLGDTNTGFYRPSADALSVTTAGLERIRVTGTDVIFGRGEAGTPVGATLRGTAGAGTNVAGADITVDASTGTGTGGSGNLIFRTAGADAVTIVEDGASVEGNTGSATATSLTISKTVGSGTGKILIVGVAIRNAASETVTSITFNGISLSLLSAVPNGVSVSTEMWYLKNPPSVTANIVVTVSAGARFVVGAASFFGVHQSSTFGTTATATGSTQLATVDVTSATGELVIDSVGKVNSTEAITVGASQNEEWNDVTTSATAGQNPIGGGSTEAGATTTTMSWSWTTTNRAWAIIGVALKPMSSSTTANALATRLQITPDGRVYGGALHNNAGAVTGATNQYIASGSYTPTLTGVLNVAASTAYPCQWLRVGNVVNVSGRVDIDPTAAAATQLGVSLPIASAFTEVSDCAGAINASSIVSQSGAVLADFTNDRAEINYVATGTANQAMYFTFTYEVI